MEKAIQKARVEITNQSVNEKNALHNEGFQIRVQNQ